jgi:AAA family ATP:ADP antiporter
MLRPVREALGVAGGVRQLEWLFLATFLAMLCVMPPFWALVTRFRRRVFIPVVFHFFTLNLLAFFVVLTLWPESEVITGRVFFVWLSVFNLMVVSLFWSVMADAFTNDQGRRLFGFIAGGGTVGALLGALLTGQRVEIVGIAPLLLGAAGMLQLALLCQLRVVRERLADGADARQRPPIGGQLLGGLTAVIRSPYLLAICGYMFFATFCGTVVYFAQATIVREMALDSEARTVIFARIELAVQATALLLQFFVTARVIRRFGVGLTLIILPALFALGFTGLGLAPVFAVLIVFQSVRRATSYGLAKPTKETLFTLVSDEEKYKSKGFIDTVVYRGGDAVSAWLFGGMRSLGLGLQGIALAAVPVALAWVGLGLFLGRKQRERARELNRPLAASGSAPPSPTPPDPPA